MKIRIQRISPETKKNLDVHKEQRTNSRKQEKIRLKKGCRKKQAMEMPICM